MPLSYKKYVGHLILNISLIHLRSDYIRYIISIKKSTDSKALRKCHAIFSNSESSVASEFDHGSGQRKFF